MESVFTGTPLEYIFLQIPISQGNTPPLNTRCLSPVDFRGKLRT